MLCALARRIDMRNVSAPSLKGNAPVRAERKPCCSESRAGTWVAAVRICLGPASPSVSARWLSSALSKLGVLENNRTTVVEAVIILKTEVFPTS